MPKEQNFRELYADTLAKMENLTERQKRVLQAALELFAEQGFEATSSQQIAQKAGVSVGSVYHHFSNKQALLVAVLSPVFQGAMTTMAQQFVDTTLGRSFESVEDFIRSSVADRLTFVHDNILVIKLMFGQLLVNQELVEQFKTLFDGQLKGMVLPTLSKMRAEGKIIDVSDEDLIQLIFSVIGGYVGKIVLNINNKTLEEEIEFASQTLIKILKP